MVDVRELSFHPVRTRRVHEEICSQVRRRLAGGLLKPGDKLPAERDMAVEFHVSRGAVREALRALEKSGLVSLHKGTKGGAFIREGDPSSLARPLQDLMVLGHLSAQSVAEARLLVSDIVASLACAHRTVKDVAVLEDSLAAIGGEGDAAHGPHASAEFFDLIAAATHSPLWIALVASLRQVAGLVDQPGMTTGAASRSLQRRIISCIRVRNAAGARRAMRQYLEITGQPVLTRMRVEACDGPGRNARTRHGGAVRRQVYSSHEI